MANINTYLWTFSEARCPHCSKCDKPIGVLQTADHGRVFCSEDTNAYRKLMRNDLQELIRRCEQWNLDWNDELRQRQNVLKTKQDKLLGQIYDWEGQSITKIKQAANEAREQARQLFEYHFTLLPKRTTVDVSPLKRAWETDGFLETHMNKWKIELQSLKSKVNRFITDFVRVKFEEPFIVKLVVDGDFSSNKPFEMPTDDYPENLTRPVYVMAAMDEYYDPYNQGVLRSGVHRFHYKGKNIFFGITSKNVNMLNEPWNTPSAYGWTTDGYIYRNGHRAKGHAEYKNNFQLGDTFLFEVDCKDKMIRLTNERTNQTYELDIDPIVCPLPWQLNVRYLNYVYQ